MKGEKPKATGIKCVGYDENKDFVLILFYFFFKAKLDYGRSIYSRGGNESPVNPVLDRNIRASVNKIDNRLLGKKKVSLHLFSLRFVNVLWIRRIENFRDIHVSST